MSAVCVPQRTSVTEIRKHGWPLRRAADLIAGVNSQKDFQLPHFGTRICPGKTPALYVEVGECLSLFKRYCTDWATASRGARTSFLQELLLHNQHSKSNTRLFCCRAKTLAWSHDKSDHIYNKMTWYLVTLCADRADQLAWAEQLNDGCEQKCS